MELKTYLTEKRKIINSALENLFPKPVGPAADVIKSMHYSLFAGGKRLRPILCLAGAEAVGGNGEHIIPVACALEYIHTYSLIHDDLPVMDNDDFRRGLPTNHRVFGEAIALLAGDGLLTEAFHIMIDENISNLCSDNDISPFAYLKVVRLIAKAAGIQGMVGGQVVDIISEGTKVDSSIVEYIHKRKTGSMIAVSVLSGAILGNGIEEQIEAIKEYGKKIGLAFQIADDILDIEGDSKTLGKGIGSDIKKKKMTYPSVHGLEKSKEIQKQLVNEAIESLNIFDSGADPLKQIATYIIERKK